MNSPSKPKIIFYLAVLFLVGGISGAAIGIASSKRDQARPRPAPGTMGTVCDFFKKKLHDRLQLTPEQIRKIDPIVEQTGREMESIHKRTLEEIEAAIKKSNAEISRELTAAQKLKFEEMERERRDFRIKRDKGRGDRERSHDRKPERR